jgi:hypothetical protein
MENWAILGDDNGLFLNGNVYGHPLHGDGRQITTPLIVRRYLDDQGVPVYVAKNKAVYQLGKINPDYEADFPQSLQRIIDEIKAGKPMPMPATAIAEEEAPAIIIEERPQPRPQAIGPGEPSERAGQVLPAASLTPFPNTGTVPVRTAPPSTPAPGTANPLPRPWTRSTDKLPDVSLFWWRPVDEDEKTDLERDEEDFERFWAKTGKELGAAESDKLVMRRLFIEGAAIARARK